MSHASRACAAVLCTLCTLSAALATTVTLDFNGASAFNTYSEDGYTFTAPSGWSVVSDTRVGQIAGGTVTTTLVESTNQPFNLLSMNDLLLAGSAGDTLKVISSAGGMVTLTNVFDVTDFTLLPASDWTNLAFVQFQLTSVNVGASVRLDNIVVETVPAPTSIAAGVLCTLVGVGARRRK